jgi:2-(1,2-epoxy-1,2-dihydrophenyl)acetyl-CoA isomerase
MKYTNLLFDLRDAVAKITLNRPEDGNALDATLIHELSEVSLFCAEERSVKSVVLTGNGRFFCVGGDLKKFGVHSDLPRFIRATATELHTAVSRLARMKKPLIVAVNGAAAGAGMSLVCAADLAIASDASKFTMAYTRAGLTPDGSSTYFLPRIVGLRRALELTLLNRTLSAAEALSWGILNQVVPESEMLNTAMALARQLADGPLEAFGKAKRLLREGWNESLETQMEWESEEIASVCSSKDAKEGIQAFIEKRRPNFGQN